MYEVKGILHSDPIAYVVAFFGKEEIYALEERMRKKIVRPNVPMAGTFFTLDHM